MKVCIVGASGKLGKYTVQHALDRSYETDSVAEWMTLIFQLVGITRRVERGFLFS